MADESPFAEHSIIPKLLLEQNVQLTGFKMDLGTFQPHTPSRKALFAKPIYFALFQHYLEAFFK